MRNRLIAVVTSAVAGVALSTVLVAPAQAGPAGHEDPGEPGVSIDVTGILGGLLGGGVSVGVEGGGKAEGHGGHKGGGDKGGDKGKGRDKGHDKDKDKDKGHDKGKDKGHDKDKDGYEAGAGAALLIKIKGTIAAVDAASGKLTVVARGGKRAHGKTTITLKANTVVVLNGAVCKLSALPVGARISVSGGATIGRTSVTAVETSWLGL